MNPDQLLQQGQAVLAQTKAEGLKSYATSKYAKKTPIDFNRLRTIPAELVASNPQPYNLNLPTPNVPSSGLQPIIDSSVATYKTQSEQDRLAREQAQTNAKSDLSKSINDIMGLNEEIGNVSSTVDRTEENKSRAEVDRLVSEIEAEQKSLQDKLARLDKNPQGLFGGALEDEKNRIRRESESRQADLSISLNAQNRNYTRAKEIADSEVQNKLEPLKIKLENLKFFYQEYKEQFNKEDERLYSEKIRSEDRAIKKEENLQQTIADVKVELAKTGNSSLIRALSGIDTSKPGAFDEVLRIAAPGLATSNNDIVKLENGNTVVVNKRTGQVISNLGGGKAPTFVPRTVNGQPVTGYTLVAGDDPYFIAMQNGIDMATLKAVNPDIKDWNNIPVGGTINIPQAPEESFMQKLQGSEGGKPLTDTTIQKLDKGLTVLAQLGVLQENVKGVKTGPIVGAFKSANPWDTQGQTIKASLNAIVPNLARGIYGEVGVLTDNDIKTYSKTIPNLKSTEDVRNAVLYITLDMIGKSIQNTLAVNEAAGRDVSGFVDLYTEMQNSKNSILASIPSASIPKAFQSPGQDPFLNQFSPTSINSNISNSSFFNQL